MTRKLEVKEIATVISKSLQTCEYKKHFVKMAVPNGNSSKEDVYVCLQTEGMQNPKDGIQAELKEQRYLTNGESLEMD